MLAKLLKYNLTWMIKPLLIFAILLMCSALLDCVTNYQVNYFEIDGQYFSEPDAPVILQILHTLFHNLFPIIAVVMIAIAVRRIWKRFQETMYGDQAYLIRTLPMSHNALWNAQFLTIIITLLGCFAFIAIADLIYAIFGQVGLIEIADSNGLGMNCLIIFLAFLEIVYIALTGITGIIIGHRTNNNRGLYSILWGFAVYLLGNAVLVVITLIISLFDSGLHTIFFGNNYAGIEPLERLFIIFTIIYAFVIAWLYLIDHKLLQNKVNLD